MLEDINSLNLLLFFFSYFCGDKFLWLLDFEHALCYKYLILTQSLRKTNIKTKSPRWA